jgi:hypothetical protein
MNLPQRPLKARTPRELLQNDRPRCHEEAKPPVKSPLEQQRDLRRERSERERKASEPLVRAYPHVRKVHLHLSFADFAGSAPAAQSHLLYPPARAFFQFPCPHADCSGQLDLDEIVTGALRTWRREVHGELMCPGVRPQRGVTSRDCELRVQYRVATLFV